MKIIGSIYLDQGLPSPMTRIFKIIFSFLYIIILIRYLKQWSSGKRRWAKAWVTMGATSQSNWHTGCISAKGLLGILFSSTVEAEGFERPSNCTPLPYRWVFFILLALFLCFVLFLLLILMYYFWVKNPDSLYFICQWR